MKTTKVEKVLYTLLYLSSLIMGYNLVMNQMDKEPLLFDEFIHVIFYFLALLTPLYMMVQWIRQTTLKRFLKVLLALIPGILFAGWLYYVIRVLGEVLVDF